MQGLRISDAWSPSPWSVTGVGSHQHHAFASPGPGFGTAQKHEASPLPVLHEASNMHRLPDSPGISASPGNFQPPASPAMGAMGAVMPASPAIFAGVSSVKRSPAAISGGRSPAPTARKSARKSTGSAVKSAQILMSPAMTATTFATNTDTDDVDALRYVSPSEPVESPDSYAGAAQRNGAARRLGRDFSSWPKKAGIGDGELGGDYSEMVAGFKDSLGDTEAISGVY